MKQLKIFIELTRLNKPIGFMLLFWPCAWGLSFAYHQNSDFDFFFHYLVLFFFGSVLMRSAGCIVNDIVDKDFDRKITRTQKRPLAAGIISVKKSLLYVLLLCSLAFLILLQFNHLTIFLGISSMFFAFSYPYMKRITYWPQLFLGLTFNWGIVMAGTSISNTIELENLILYASAIFWTLGYDTIYGAQDMSDDEIIGLKSTSIKFKKHIKLFVSICYLISSILLILLLYDKIRFNLSSLFIILFFFSLINQIIIFNKKKPLTCLNAFKQNNYSGLFLFLGLYLESINYGI
tara:strand:+ start:43 stop:915 length:873 start_codon:yes stop_codon:yes gene_type:complete